MSVALSECAQLLATGYSFNETTQHTADLDRRILKSFGLFGIKKSQIPGKNHEVLQFADGTYRDEEKLAQLRIAASPATLGDVCRNRSSATAHLGRKSVTFRVRKRGRCPIDTQGQRLAFSPYMKLVKILHVEAPWRCAIVRSGSAPVYTRYKYRHGNTMTAPSLRKTEHCLVTTSR